MNVLGPSASDLGFRLDAADIAPVTDPAWSFASDDIKREYFRRAAHLVRAQYEREREQGLAPDGGKLARLSKRTIANRRSAMTSAADPVAEPFVPGHHLSRTISFLRTIASKDGLFVTWKRDPRLQGKSFGLLLWWHKEGFTNAPRRDVFFLSAQGKAKVRRAMIPWWLPRARQAAQKAVLDASTITRDQIKITVPPGAQVVPREQRRTDDKWGFGRKREFRRRVAVSGVDVATEDGGRLGPGTVTRRLMASGPLPPPPGPPRGRQGPPWPRPPVPVSGLRAPVLTTARPLPMPKPAMPITVKSAVGDWIDLVADVIFHASGGGKAQRVYVADVRESFPQIPRDLMDKVLRELLRRGQIVMYGADEPWTRFAPRHQAAAFRTLSGDQRHIIYWQPKVNH